MVATLLVEVYITSVSRDWRDLYTRCTYVLPVILPCGGVLLDPSNEIHIFALHCVLAKNQQASKNIFLWPQQWTH